MPLILVAVLLAVGCSKGPPDLSSEPSRFARTERKGWSESGWEGVRWGMGPGDVEVHVGPKGMKIGGVYEPAPSEAPDPRISFFVLKDSSRRRGEVPVHVAFNFFENRLYQVLEEPELPEHDFGRATRWAWDVRVAVARGGGEPTEEQGKELLAQAKADKSGSYGAVWRGPAGTVAVGLLAFKYQDDPVEVNGWVATSDDAISRKASEALTAAQAEREAQQQAAAAAARAKAVPSRTLSGKVLEVAAASPYTYAKLQASYGTSWIAVPSAAITVGETVCVVEPMRMTDFENKRLNRKFSVIYFGTIGSALDCAGQ